MTAITRLSIYFAAFILICSCLLPPTAAAQKTDPVIPAQAGNQTSSSETAVTIDFSNDTISEPVNVDFWKRQIQDTLKGVEIDSTSSPSRKWQPRVIFHRPVSFLWATFDSEAFFLEATFHSKADFKVTTFEDTASFRETKFKSSADFRWVTFDATAYFRGATFDSTANFFGATFDATADFRRATFGTWVNFRWARFQGEVDFWRTKLPDSLDFRYVTDIKNEIDFTYCSPPRKGGKCRIALEGMDISKLKLNMNLFELWFPEVIDIDTTVNPTIDRTIEKTVDSTLNVSIDTIADTNAVTIMDTTVYPTYDQKLSIYEQVLKKLENDGFMDSYKILDIEYRQFKYDHKWYGSVVNALHKIWWNYGYDKERILFIWTPLFFIVFAFLNLFLWYGTLSDEVYGVAFLEKIPHAAGRMKRAAKKVLQVMAYTGIVFFGLKMDVSKFKKGAIRQHPWLFTYLMSIYVVGLVCLGFIVNIIFTR